jgi:hypothetical protein
LPQQIHGRLHFQNGQVEEEADESGYWMELLADAGKVKAAKMSALLQEAGELTAIAVSSINTARKSQSPC